MPPTTASPPPVPPEIDRYSRQVLFAGIGAAGQERLALSHAAIVGVGATGAATASLLARAGVGRLTLIDRDVVEHSNLQRQMLFDEADAGEGSPKAEAARRHIAEFNSGIRVTAIVDDLAPSNIAEHLAGAELLLDCTDNYETRYLLNDFAVREGLPWIYAGAVGAQASTMTILPVTDASIAPWEATACLACLFPEPPGGAAETCDTAGILGGAVNLAASLQATEALKLLTGQYASARRSFLSFDLWGNGSASLSTATPDPGCAVCGERHFRHLAGMARPYITLCGRNSVQIHEHRRPVDLTALHARLSPLAAAGEIAGLRATPMLLRFLRGPLTLTLFPDGRALIQGTTNVGAARSLYARFIGN